LLHKERRHIPLAWSLFFLLLISLASLTFPAHGAPGPDLTVENVWLERDSQPGQPAPAIQPGEAFNIVATIKNIGDAAGYGFYLDAYYDSDYGRGGPDDIAPGEVQEWYVGPFTEQSGTHTTRWVVDPDNQIVELNELNNEKEYSFTIGPQTVTTTVTSSTTTSSTEPTSTETTTTTTSTSYTSSSQTVTTTVTSSTTTSSAESTLSSTTTTSTETSSSTTSAVESTLPETSTTTTSTYYTTSSQTAPPTLTLNPTSGPMGTLVSASGSNYQGAACLLTAVPSSLFTSQSCSIAAGTLTGDFTVDSRASAGNYTVAVQTDAGPVDSATSTFTVTLTYMVTFYADPDSAAVTVDGVTMMNGGTGTYSAGQRVRVVANPPPGGYAFLNWEASGVAVDDQLSHDTYVTVSNDGWLKAHFGVPVVFQLDGVSSDAAGTILTVDSASYQFSHFPLTLSLALGTHNVSASTLLSVGTSKRYAWVSWSDSQPADHTIMASGPATYAITYKTEFALSVFVSPFGGGTTNPSADESPYWEDAGTTVSVTETPNAGYSFDHWGLDEANVGGASSYNVLMDSAHTLTAFFRGTFSASLWLSAGSVPLGTSVTLFGTTSAAQSSPGISSGTVVVLSYSLDGGTSWNDFIATRADAAGGYSVAWYPPRAGDYQIRATLTGNADYEGPATASVSLSVTGTMPPQVTLLISGLGSAARATTVTFDVLVANPGDYLSTVLYIELVGSNGYRYFATQQISVGAGTAQSVQFVWQVPPTLAPGNYQVYVGLIPPKPTALAQTEITIT